MCVGACMTAVRLQSDKLMGGERGQSANVGPQVRGLRVEGLGN